MSIVLFIIRQLIIACLFTSQATSQSSDSLSHMVTVDSLQVDTMISKKHWIIPAAKSFSANAIPFAMNYFVREKSFANISLQSIGENLKLSSWEWDVDRFFNNQFSHPYQGSMYFNAYRSEGYGFWRSTPAVLAGSLTWEIFAEVDKPSINDLINTTLGGISFGEIMHRLGRRFTQNWRSGKKKNALDVFGIMVDPMEGLSTLASKRRQKLMGRNVDTTTIQFEFSGGARQYNREVNNTKVSSHQEWFSRLNLVYGAELKKLRTPFSYFSVLTELGTSDSALFNIAQIRGSLMGWNLQDNSKNQHHALLTMNYNYYHNVAFAYSMQGFQMNLFSRFLFSPKFNLRTELSGGVIGLAALFRDDLNDAAARNYDYGSGAVASAAASLFFLNRLSLRSTITFSWLRTLNGQNPLYKVISSNSAIRYQLKKRIFFVYEFGHFFFKTWYSDDRSNRKHNFYKRIGIGYQFSL